MKYGVILFHLVYLWIDNKEYSVQYKKTICDHNLPEVSPIDFGTINTFKH